MNYALSCLADTIWIPNLFIKANLIICPFVGGINVSSLHWLDTEKQIKLKEDLLQNHYRTYCLELTSSYTKQEITFSFNEKEYRV